MKTKHYFRIHKEVRDGVIGFKGGIILRRRGHGVVIEVTSNSKKTARDYLELIADSLSLDLENP